PNEKTFVHIDDIPARMWQTSLGNESHYLDAGYKPQFPFGFGLSYTKFSYSNLTLSDSVIRTGDNITISAVIKNRGHAEAEEVVQLYTRDLVASITPPVKELRRFKRIQLKPGESQTVQFTLNTSDLAFYNQEMELVTEPGTFHIWIASDSDNGLRGKFDVKK
ncbi:MAG: fibronectin type III-like domain-contianing protein, partial [Candidatus Marinimicrobia bacterium]|nr:fibronectin type III-like domain-contianing protein [Candidatus Neomarinimicrobiota bacterium]